MRTMAAKRLALAMTIGLLPLAACKTPQQQEAMVQAMQPMAIDAAKDRARTDLNCQALQTAVLSTEHGDLGDQYSLHRVVYRVEVKGCRLRTVYSVACVPNAVCSAISESGTVDRTQ